MDGERVELGTIYTEGAYVRREVRVPIADWVSGRPSIAQQHLPDPYRLEVKFSETLVSATEGIQPGFNPQKAQFWVGTLDCNSAAPSDKPYKIEMTLYAGGETRKHTKVSFLVADAPGCGGGGPEPGEGGGGGKKPPVRP